MPRNGTILALDLAGRCGVATGTRADGVIDSGAWRNARKGRDAGYKFAALYDTLEKFTEDLGAVGRPVERITYEEPATLRSKAANAAIYGYVAVTQMFCEKRKLPFRSWHLTSVKKRATGRGNAKKPSIIAAAEAEFAGHRILCSDQADALWVLTLELEQLAREESA